MAGARELTRRGMTHAKEGQLRDAVRSYDQAILAADHLPALMNRACAYYHLGDFERAARDSSWALEIDRKRTPMWLVRGLARFHLGDAERASKDLAKYLRLDTKTPYRALAKRALRKLQTA